MTIRDKRSIAADGAQRSNLLRGIRFPFRPTLRAAATAGMFLFTAACGGSYGMPVPGDADSSEPTVGARAGASPLDRPSSGSLEESLARLDALELLEISGLYETRTEHQWIPYGGIWSEQEVALSDAEKADRLARFVDVAEAAVAAADAAPGSDAPFDSEALCWPVDDESYCLTHSMHDEDLQALDALEIVHVDGMVLDETETTAACYSSWATVTRDDCSRALRVRAVVEATAGFTTRNPPAGDEQP